MGTEGDFFSMQIKSGGGRIHLNIICERFRCANKCYTAAATCVRAIYIKNCIRGRLPPIQKELYGFFGEGNAWYAEKL